MADEEEELNSLRRAVMSSFSKKGKDLRVIKSSRSSRQGADAKKDSSRSSRHKFEQDTRKRRSDGGLDYSDFRDKASRRESEHHGRKIIDERSHVEPNQTGRVRSHVQIVEKHNDDRSFLITVKNDAKMSSTLTHSDTRHSDGHRYRIARLKDDDRTDYERGEGRLGDEEASDMDSDYTIEMRSQKESDESDYSVEFANFGGSEDEVSDLEKEEESREQMKTGVHDALENADFHKLEKDEGDESEDEVGKEEGEESEDDEYDSLENDSDAGDLETGKIKKEDGGSDGFVGTAEFHDQIKTSSRSKRTVILHSDTGDSVASDDKSGIRGVDGVNKEEQTVGKGNEVKSTEAAIIQREDTGEKKKILSAPDENVAKQGSILNSKLEKTAKEVATAKEKIEDHVKKISEEKLMVTRIKSGEFIVKGKRNGKQEIEGKAQERLQKNEIKGTEVKVSSSSNAVTGKESKKSALSEKSDVKGSRQKDDVIVKKKSGDGIKTEASDSKNNETVMSGFPEQQITPSKEEKTLVKREVGNTSELKQDATNSSEKEHKGKPSKSSKKMNPSNEKVAKQLKDKEVVKRNCVEKETKPKLDLKKAENKDKQKDELERKESKEKVTRKNSLKNKRAWRDQSRSSSESSCSTCSGSGSSSSVSSSDSSGSGSESRKSSESETESSSGSSQSSSSDSESSSSDEENFKRRKKVSVWKISVNDRRRGPSSPRNGKGRGYVSPLRTKKSEWGTRKKDDQRVRDKYRHSSPRLHDNRNYRRSNDRTREGTGHRSQRRSRSREYTRRERDNARERERGDAKAAYKGYDIKRGRRDSYDRRDKDRPEARPRSEDRMQGSKLRGHLRERSPEIKNRPERGWEGRIAKPLRERSAEKKVDGSLDCKARQGADFGKDQRTEHTGRSRSSLKREHDSHPEKNVKSDAKLMTQNGERDCKSLRRDDKKPKPLMEQKLSLKSLTSGRELIDKNKGNMRKPEEGKDYNKIITSNTEEIAKGKLPGSKQVSTNSEEKQVEEPRPLMEITLPNIKKPVAKAERRPLRRVSVTGKAESHDKSERLEERQRRRVTRVENRNPETRDEIKSRLGSREKRAGSPSNAANKAYTKTLSSGKTLLLNKIEPLMKPMDFEFGIVVQPRTVEPRQDENELKNVRRVVTDFGSDLSTAIVEITTGDVDETQPQPKRKVFSRLGKSVINKPKSIAINMKPAPVKDNQEKQIVEDEEETELDEKIKQIREKNEEILRRQKEIEDDIKLNS